jgi:hypothetical protein
MPKYDDLSDEEINAIYQYIRVAARNARDGKQGSGW